MDPELRKPYLCVQCALPLPIVISQSQDAQSIECASCGARYRGHIWQEIPEEYERHIRVLKREQ